MPGEEDETLMEAIKGKCHVGDLLGLDKDPTTGDYITSDAIVAALASSKLDGDEIANNLKNISLVSFIGEDKVFDGENLNGVWSLMFKDKADAESKKLSDLGTLFENVGKNMFDTKLSDLKTLQIIDESIDLTKPLSMSVANPLGGDAITVSIDKENPNKPLGDYTLTELIKVLSKLGGEGATE